MFKMSKGDIDNNLTMGTDEEDIDEYISRSSLQMTLLVVTLILILLFFLGSIGNCLSLGILFHQRMRNQVNIMLGALCISDTLFLFHCFLFTSINIYKKFNPVAGEAWRATLYPYLGAYGSVVTARITSCLTTLLCIERCVAVFYPMQARMICSKRNTVIAILGIALLTLGAFVPFIFKYEAKTIIKDENTTLYVLNKTEFYLSHVKFYSVYGTILNIIFRFAPLGIIPILNICMIRAVHQAWRLRRDISGHHHGHTGTRLTSQRPFSSTSQHRITLMLVIVAFIFFICILPGAVNSIITHTSPSYSRLGKYKNLYFFIASLTFLLETLNSSINFIIYMAMSRKFRLLYKEKYCCGNGKYYNKISMSSVKDRFKWVSSRKSTDSDQSSKDPYRKTVSDTGPNRNMPASRRALYDCIHSDEIHVPDKKKPKTQSTWIIDSKCCMNGRALQNSDEEKFNISDSTALNGVDSNCGKKLTDQNGCCHKRKAYCETVKPRHGECTKRKFHWTKDSLRNPRRKNHTSNPGFYKMTINNIYNIDQELPYISNNFSSKEARGVERSNV